MCPVHPGMFSTSGDTMSTSWGYHEYIGGGGGGGERCSVHLGIHDVCEGVS